MGSVVEENKSLIVSKLAQFENELFSELANSQKQIEKKFLPYDDSMAKIETDLIKLMTNVSTFQSELNNTSGEMTQQRKLINADLETFYNTYEARLNNSGMSENDKHILQQTVDELNQNINKNRNNIQLLAKEMEKTNEKLDENVETTKAEQEKSNKNGKTI